MTRAAVIALAVLGLAGAPGRARAGDPTTTDTLTMRVTKQNDTLEMIAAEFYGDRNRAIFIMVANKMTHPRPLKLGERLRIPVSRTVSTLAGDTYATVAQTFLGDVRRGPFLAELNHAAGSADDALPAGTQVRIPLTVSHTAQATESITQIALAYFGDKSNTELIRSYNFLDRSAIEKGETIIIPAPNVQLAAAKMPPTDAESAARVARRTAAEATVAKALPAARMAWRAGDFAAVKGALAQVEPQLDFLEVAEAVEVGVLLGEAHVAYEDTDLALAVFKRVVARAPHHALGRYDASPSILDVWQKAGGAVE